MLDERDSEPMSANAVSDQAHTVPAELVKPPPRRVIRRPGTLGIGTILGRLFFIPVALFGLYVLAWVPIKAIVAFRGQVVTGRIDGKEESSGKNTHYHITYSYKIAGQTHAGRREVDDVSDFDRLAVNQPIPVHVALIFGHYFDEVLFEGERPAKPALDQLLLSLVPNVLLTGSLFYIVFLYYWLQKRLCRRGTPVPGRITSKKIHRSKSSTYYDLHFEFAHPRLGISKSHNSIAFSQWEKATEGELVTVLCHPNRFEHASVIYEYGNFMCI